MELAHERLRFGYRWLHALVEREGSHANHTREHRLYREADLAVDAVGARQYATENGQIWANIFAKKSYMTSYLAAWRLEGPEGSR